MDLFLQVFFFGVGYIYDRYGTRNLKEIGELYNIVPKFTFFVLVLLIANMSFPGTIGFVGELGILIAAFQVSYSYTILIIFATILNTGINIWLATRILYGPFKEVDIIKHTQPLTQRETHIMKWLAWSIVILGLLPTEFVDLFKFAFYASVGVSIKL